MSPAFTLFFENVDLNRLACPSLNKSAICWRWKLSRQFQILPFLYTIFSRNIGEHYFTISTRKLMNHHTKTTRSQRIANLSQQAILNPATLNMTTVSSRRTKSKNKDKPNKKGGTEIVQEDRVESLLKEAKAKSRARVAARKKKKMEHQKAAEDKKRKEEERREQLELKKLQKKSDEEFAESLKLCDYFDAEAQRQRKNAMEKTNDDAGDVDMSVSSETPSDPMENACDGDNCINEDEN